MFARAFVLSYQEFFIVSCFFWLPTYCPLCFCFSPVFKWKGMLYTQTIWLWVLLEYDEHESVNCWPFYETVITFWKFQVALKIIKVEEKLSRGWGGENAYHVSGYRYLLVDDDRCISRASPPGKVTTLTKVSFSN